MVVASLFCTNMTRKEKIKIELIDEIQTVISNHIDNVKSGLASDREKQILFESLGFLNLINYSSMDILEIKKQWDKTTLPFG